MNPRTVNLLDLPSLRLQDRRQLPKISCVYFLLYRNKVRYIGQTKNLRVRFAADHDHRDRLENKRGVKVCWLAIEGKEARLETERQLIKEYSNSPALLNGMSRSKFYKPPQ